MESAQVLVVDDEADVIQPLRLRLETAGYRTITASDGAEALELLRQQDVDLILSDLMMPNLDGLELTRRIRQDPRLRSVRVLLFSCHDDPVSRDLALEFGALEYLSKAIGAAAIISRVNEILGAAGSGGATLPPKAATGELAEHDLRAQLQALDAVSGPPSRRPRKPASVPEQPPRAPQQENPRYGMARQLRRLARALENLAAARR